MTGSSPSRVRPRRRRVLPAALLLGAGGGLFALLRRSGTAAPAPAPAPLPGRPRLVAVLGGSVPRGEAEAAETLLHEGRQVVGRARDADVRLRDLSVSPRHALLQADHEGRVVVRDLGALNGVHVDGVPVAEVELHDGNRVQLGDVQLVFRTDPAHDGGGRSGGELGENLGS